MLPTPLLIGGGDAVEVRWQVGIRVISAVAPTAADIARRQIPTGPDWLHPGCRCIKAPQPVR